MRSYPTLFDGFFKQLHHIGSLHAARFKSLCPGDQDGLHRRAQRGWKRARRPPQPPDPWGACSRTVTKLRPGTDTSHRVTDPNSSLLFIHPHNAFLWGLSQEKKPAAHTQSVAGQCSGVSQHADLTGVNCTARLHLERETLLLPDHLSVSSNQTLVSMAPRNFRQSQILKRNKMLR